MSVLIKGMEMPKLYKTYKVRFSEEGGKILVGFADENSTAYRPIGEAIPVPPHGDLIDRDALCKTLRSLAENEYTPEVFANWIENHIDTIIEAEEGET